VREEQIASMRAAVDALCLEWAEALSYPLWAAREERRIAAQSQATEMASQKRKGFYLKTKNEGLDNGH